MESNVINKVRKAVYKTCKANGIEEPEVMRSYGFEATSGISTMSVAGYKAGEARRRNRIRCRLSK